MKWLNHAPYWVVIFLLSLKFCDKPVSPISIPDIRYDTIRADMVRLKHDTVRIYQTDTISLSDTLKMRDTVYILRDWATPRVFVNNYSDTNYTLTVTDSINFNKLISQRVQISVISSVISSEKSSVWLNYQTPLTMGISYHHKRGVSVSGSYDLLNGSPVFGVGLRLTSQNR